MDCAAWHAHRTFEAAIFQAELDATAPDLVPEIIAFHRRAVRRLDLVLAGKMPHPHCDFRDPAPRLRWPVIGRTLPPDPPPDDPAAESTEFRPDQTPEMRIAQETPQWS